MPITRQRRVPRPDRRAGALLGLVSVAFLLFGALAPGMLFASDRAEKPGRWACVGSDHALDPTPPSGVVQSSRARPWSRATTTGHGLCADIAPRSAGNPGAVATAGSAGPPQATPNLVRRRGPPQPTS